MQQRQLRLGDILDDYCPRERRLTNHAVVAMIGPDVKQTRCTTCDAEHEYKHAQIPRQRRKPAAAPALASAPAAAPVKRILPVPTQSQEEDSPEEMPMAAAVPEGIAAADLPVDDFTDTAPEPDANEEGPVHRPLIRATLPRLEGQPPPTRPASDFTIRQPTGRANRFRPRHQRADQFHGNRNGGPMRTGSRQNSGRDAVGPRPSNRRGPGRRRSK
jgi:hypothetical protein